MKGLEKKSLFSGKKSVKSEYPVIRENNRETVVCGTGMVTGGFVQRGHQVAYPIPLICRNRAGIRDRPDYVSFAGPVLHRILVQ